MKQWSEEQKGQLAAWSSEVSVDLTDDVREALLLHLSLVIDKNQVLNLTRIVDDESALRLHLVDSLAVLPEVDACPKGPLCDLGTGAGFPGLPLAILTRRPVTLVESVKKKAASVLEFVQQLGLSSQVDVFPGRAEELAQDPGQRGRYICCTARALSSMSSLLELSSPLLALGGRLIALKARPDASELAAADRVAKHVGMRALTDREFILPGGEEIRTILVYEKVGPASLKLPRRPGMAQRQPLV